MRKPPSAWSPEQAIAIDELVDAINHYKAVVDFRTAISDNSQIGNAIVADLRAHIKDVLLPSVVARFS